MRKGTYGKPYVVTGYKESRIAVGSPALFVGGG